MYFVCAFGFSQEYKDLYDRISTFKFPMEYDNIDCEIIEATSYIFDMPYDEEVIKEDFAYKSIVEWMNETKTYHIIKGGKIMQDCKKGSVLYNICRLSMTQYLFDNDSIVQKSVGSGVRYININRVREIIYGGGEIFMEYLNKQEKSVTKKQIPKPLKKGLKQYNEGDFESYMSYN